MRLVVKRNIPAQYKNKGINVLSLFDGISCGMVALERAGIKVNRYVAYEIELSAIKISNKNYPQIEQCGDVTTADFTKYKGFDLLIGGSPCTYWSIANNNREATPNGIGGQLFMHYVRALKESGCRYFLYENNFSIHKDIKDFISEKLGVQPIIINSALVSAQQRKRCYWTNIPNIEQPKDKGIVLKTILESVHKPINLNNYKLKKYKQYAENHNGEIPVMFNAYNTKSISEKSPTMTASCGIGNTTSEVIWFEKINKNTTKPIRLGHYGKVGQGQRIYSVEGKSICLTSQSGRIGDKTGIYKIDLPDGDYIICKLSPLEVERLQTLPDNYTEGVSNTQRYKCIGNGWTVDVIAHIFRQLKEELNEFI